MQNKSYSQRAKVAKHSLGKDLLELMDKKRTNLGVALDVASSKEFLKIANEVGPHICLLKTHIDILEDFSLSFIEQLTELAVKHNFLIFEDRKFADIGNTVKLQYEKGMYHIASWAHIVNTHILPGPGIIEGLKTIGLPLNRGLLLLAEMSSEGNLFSETYTSTAVRWAEIHQDFVIGFISRRRLSFNESFIYLTPGVSLHRKNDAIDQNYFMPKQVIGSLGSDIILVGRDIYEAKSPGKQAELYRTAGWDAYEFRLDI